MVASRLDDGSTVLHIGAAIKALELACSSETLAEHAPQPLLPPAHLQTGPCGLDCLMLGMGLFHSLARTWPLHA